MRPGYRRGQVYPLFAFFLIPLLAVSALSVDIGYYRYQQRLQQTAADSAAITGALQSQTSSDASTIATTAKTDAQSNGFTDGSNNVTVTVTPQWTDGYTASGTGGLSAAAGTGVKVTITKQYGRFFGGFFFGGKQSITTSAVAIMNSINSTTGKPCFTGMGDAPSITTANGAKISGPQCGIEMNGDTTCNGGTIDVASFAINSAATNNCSGGGTKFPSASPVPSSAITDPCNVDTSCQYIVKNLDGKVSCGKTLTGTVTGAQTSSFTNGSFTCLNGATINAATFGSGVYVIENGALFSGTNSGSGVLFYVADDNACACSAKNGDVLDMETKNTTLNFSSPEDGAGSVASNGDGSTGGNYAGILFYQNPANLTAITPGCKSGSGTVLNCVQIAATIGGTCPPGTEGNWYMRYASFVFDGHNNDCFTGNLVVDDATLNGLGSQVTLNPPAGGSGSGGGTVAYKAYLVE